MRLLISLVLLWLLPGFAWSVWVVLLNLAQTNSWIWLIAGAVAGVVIDQVVLRRLPGFETFEHELTHAVAALMLFRRIDRFVVTRYQGGYVRHSGGFGGELGDELIGLAPYVLPTFTFFSVLARPFVPGGWFPWYDLWIGLTFGFHTWSTMRETRRNFHRGTFRRATDGELTRSDLGRRGLAYSAIAILTLTCAVHGGLIAIVIGGYSGLGPWWRLSWETTVGVVFMVLGLIQRQLG